MNGDCEHPQSALPEDQDDLLSTHPTNNMGQHRGVQVDNSLEHRRGYAGCCQVGTALESTMPSSLTTHPTKIWGEIEVGHAG